ncbi:MAG: choice-of-anchor G family protein [Aeromicrobium sp.]|uniref:choice-of-anchor G family protein n=1 Tax=Aeromicrobium sp. TaxID=1871063 RepID=UPI0039E57D36
MIRSRLRSAWYLLQMLWYGVLELFWFSAEKPVDLVEQAKPTTRRGRRQWGAVGKSLRWTTGTTVAALVAAQATVVVASNASWVDEEWDYADYATLNCADDEIFKTRGMGRLLGGGLLPVDLDTVATVGGVTVTNDGTRAQPDPANASSVGDDAYVNPLDVNALSLIDLPLTGGGLDEFLSLDLANDVGVLNQFARAKSDGHSQGASGVVNDSGVVQTQNNDDGSTPTLGTLKLSTLVQQLTGEAVGDVASGIADLSLEIGAVAGRSTLDACQAAWTGDIDPYLDRTYAIAGLAAVIDAPVVAGLSTTATGALDTAETTVNGLASDASVVSGITSGVGALLNGVIDTLSLGSVTLVGPTVTADLSAARSLVNATVSDDNDTVELDLSTGEVRVDLAALIGEAYGGEGFNGSQAHGLNGLPPNTELLVNDAVTNALVSALTQALDNWVQDIVDAVRDALLVADVHLEVKIPLSATVLGQTLDVLTVNVTVDGTVQEVMDGTAAVDVDPVILSRSGLLGAAINALVTPLVDGIVSALTTGILPVVGDVLNTALFESGGVVPTLGNTLSSATAPVVEALADVLVGFLGVDGLVSLRANLQNDPTAGNDPDPTDPDLLYPDWETGSQAVPDYRYDVAALGVGVLNVGGTGANVNLELARGSVGVNCGVGGVWDRQGLCAGY